MSSWCSHGRQLLHFHFHDSDWSAAMQETPVWQLDSFPELKLLWCPTWQQLCLMLFCLATGDTTQHLCHAHSECIQQATASVIQISCRQLWFELSSQWKSFIWGHVWQQLCLMSFCLATGETRHLSCLLKVYLLCSQFTLDSFLIDMFSLSSSTISHPPTKFWREARQESFVLQTSKSATCPSVSS